MTDKFVEKIFGAFNSRNIPYCVLRNYSLLPGALEPGSDIDIFIDEARRREASGILIDTAKSCGLEISQVIVRQHVAQYRLFRFSSAADYSFLQIDLNYRENYLGADYLDAAAILKNRKRRGDFYIPCPVHEAVISMFGRFLTSGGIKEKYMDFIQRAFSENRQEFIATLDGMLGRRLSGRLSRHITNGEWGEFPGLRNRIRLAIWLRAFLNRPARTSWAFFSVCCHAVKHWISPPGMVVAILGIDGSGKSMVAEKALGILKKLFISEVSCILHWRPAYLPALRSVFNKKAHSKPDSVAPSGSLVSFARLLYYMIDIIFGFYVKVRGLERQNAIIIFDRYAYDFFVDPKRYGFDLSGLIFKLFLPLIPGPDLTLYLEASGATLYSRKQELSPEEIARQAENFKTAAPFLPNLEIIDAEEPPDEVVGKVIRAILNRRASLTRKGIAAVRGEDGPRDILKRVYGDFSGARGPRTEGAAPYLALPDTADMRWLLPLDIASAHGQEAFDFYNPSRLKARLFKSALIAAMRSKYMMRLFRGNVLFNVAEDKGSIKNILSGLFGKDIDLSLSLDPAIGKAVGIVIDADGRVLAYSKMGFGSYSSGLVRREYEALKRLNGLNLTSCVLPETISFYEGVESAYIVETPTGERRPRRRMSKMSRAHIKFLAELSSLTGKKAAFRGNAAHKKIRAALSGRPGLFAGEWPARCKRGLEMIETMKGEGFRTSTFHGDFVPWNVSVSGDAQKLRVTDWEHCEDDCPPLWDAFHFMSHTGVLLNNFKKWKLSKLLLKDKDTLDLYGKICPETAGDRAALEASLALYIMNMGLRYFDYREAACGLDGQTRKILNVLGGVLDELIEK